MTPKGGGKVDATRIHAFVTVKVLFGDGFSKNYGQNLSIRKIIDIESCSVKISSKQKICQLRHHWKIDPEQSNKSRIVTGKSIYFPKFIQQGTRRWKYRKIPFLLRYLFSNEDKGGTIVFQSGTEEKAINF